MTLLAVWSPLLLLVLITNCFTSVEGATFASMEPCPEGVAAGSTWYPEMFPGTTIVADCLRCTCQANGIGYGCYSCGVGSMPLSGPECYIAKTDPGGNYPACCAMDERCPGHPRYDADEAFANIG